MARRLTRWGARACVVADETVAAALLPERAWDAVLVDHALGARRPRRGWRAQPRAMRAAHRADHAGRARTSCRR